MSDVIIHLIPPAICYDEAPESQNEANLVEDADSQFGMAPPADRIGYCPRCGSANYYAIQIWAGDGNRYPRIQIDTDSYCSECGY
jgi:hypothetical protein